MPANLVFRRKIWGARDNGIPPRSTPVYVFLNHQFGKKCHELNIIMMIVLRRRHKYIWLHKLAVVSELVNDLLSG